VTVSVVTQGSRTEGWVLYCASVSKVLSPGFRIGWCAPGRYQLKVEQLKMAMNLSTAVIPQLTIAAFLTNGGYDRHLRQLRRTFELQVDRMTQAIYAHFPAETKITRPKGGFILWLEFPAQFDSLVYMKKPWRTIFKFLPASCFHPRGTIAIACGSPADCPGHPPLKPQCRP
jgi:DNA-binding transcriptional MocR family regulator